MDAERDARRLIDKVSELRGKVGDLKNVNSKLLRANKLLVNLLLDMEEVLKDQENVDVFEGQDYSFESGWMDSEERHKETLRKVSETGDGSTGIRSSLVEDQIEQVQKLINQVQKYL